MVEFAGLGIAIELGESADHTVQLEMPELVEGGMLQHDVSSVEVRLMEVVWAADVEVIDRRPVRGLWCAALEIVLEDGSERGIGRGADLQSPFASRFQPFAAMDLGEAEDADTGAEALFGMGFGAQNDADQDPGMGPVGGGPASDAFLGPIGIAAV